MAMGDQKIANARNYDKYRQPRRGNKFRGFFFAQEVHAAALQNALLPNHLRQDLLREGERDRLHGHPVDLGLLPVLD